MKNDETLKKNINRLDQYIFQSLTYKQITDILNIQYLTNNSKKRQLNEIACYYDIEKVGNKYRILEKYDMPLLYTDNKYSKYYNDLEVLMLYILNSTNKNTISMSITNALTSTNFVNDNYTIGIRNIEATADAIEVDIQYLNTFYDSTRKRFKRIFENALDKMQDSRLIDYTLIKMVCKKETIIKSNDFYEPIVYDDNKIDYKVVRTYQEATETEYSIIVDVENEVMQSMGYGSINRLIGDGKYRSFSKKVNDILKAKLNIIYYYNAYKIIKGERAINRQVKEIEKYIAENNLNKNSIKAITTSTEAKLNIDRDSKDLCIDIFINNDTLYNLKNMIDNRKRDKKHIDTDIPF